MILMTNNPLNSSQLANKHFKSWVIIALIFLSISPIYSYAQIGNQTKKTINTNSIDSTNKLEDVVVTAQKIAERVQKIPLAVTAINAKQIKELQLWNTKDISSFVPNVYAADPGDGRDAISIRGIATTSYDPTVAVYIDGVNQFNLDTYIPSLHNIERIEVLRGPQGTLYGRNAMGGVINIITKEPSNMTKGFAEISLGNYNQQKIEAGFATPIIKNKLFFGASGLYNSRDGYYNNQFNNSSYDQQHEFSGNYFINWMINSNWTAKLNLKHRNQQNKGAFPLVADLQETFSNPYQLNQNALTKMMDNTFNSSLSLNYTGKHFNFNSLTAYQKNYRYYTNPIDGDFSPYDIITVVNNYGSNYNNIKAYTQEFKFSATPTSKIKWTTGAYLFYQEAPVRQGTHFGEMASMMVGDSLFSIINTTNTIRKGFALFGQTSFNLLDKLEITLGLRSDYENVDQNVLGLYGRDGDKNILITTPSTSASTSFNAISPKIALAYQWTDNSLLYAQFSRGFRTGGLSPLSSDPSQPALIEYKPEYSNSFEIGLKNELFEKKIRINLAYFYTKVTDAQVPSLVLPDAVTITKNVGKLNSNGFEAEITALPSKGWMLQYNLGVTDAKFESLFLSQQGQSVDLKGKRQLFTPDLSSFLAVQYNHSLLNKSLNGFIRAEWKYTGNTYFDLANTIKQNAYAVVNASAGLQKGKYGVKIWSKNITGQKFISYAYDFGAYHLGDPAHYGVTCSYTF